MSIKPTSESSSLLPNEQSDGSSTNTLSLFEDSIFNRAHDGFEVHLDNHPVDQNILDRCLMSGFLIVQKQERELSQAAPTLQLLLKFGAQWINDALFENVMSPYHVICKSTGDHHELLDLMLLSSGQTLIDKEYGCNDTALVYAIQNANINCVRSLLNNGANVNHYSSNSTNRIHSIKSPLVEAMSKWDFNLVDSAIIKAEIFDLLLASGADVNDPYDIHTPPPVLCALDCGNIECMKKLIQRGARLGWTSYEHNYIWSEIARKGNLELLKIIIEHGIDKDSTDTDDKSMLRLVIESGDIEAVCYLLDLGVTLPTYQPEAELKPCKKCVTDRLHLDDQALRDPCVAAIGTGNLNIIQLLEKHGEQGFNFFNVIRKAVCSPDVTEYLLNKYTYPLNIEYTIKGDSIGPFNRWTILIEACHTNSVDVAKMLLDHGADPNKWIFEGNYFSAINIAIHKCSVTLVAHLIRSGLDINSRSSHNELGYLLPFEAAILADNLRAAKMFLVSGASFGVYSLYKNHEFKANIKPDLKNSMKTWNVYLNNVNPLEQQCRRVILKDLSPQAHKKIEKLPLPHCLIEYLSIPELDDIVSL